MLILLTVVVIVTVAGSQWREGLLSAAILFVNVVLASILAANFWEPLADELDVLFSGDMLAGYEDALALTFLFTGFLTLLRVGSGKLVIKGSAFSGRVEQIGGGAFGVLAGYLVAGMLVCVLQTLPWHENFFNFKPRFDGEPMLRRFLPPDRVWLALVRGAGTVPLAWKEDQTSPSGHSTFDAAQTFELRYLRYRRYGDVRDPLKYDGEFDRELGKEKPR